MDLLTVMWKVAAVVGGVFSIFFGIVFMLTTFMSKEKLAKMGARGTKTKHRVIVFILGYLLLCFGVYLIYLLF